MGNSNVLLSIIILTVSLSRAQNVKIERTIILAHVLFRHGDRAPDKSSLYPTNPYLDEKYYEPYGFGQLTNEGKQREYNLGLLLRDRYQNFLGDSYIFDMVDARTTDVNRTKMSLQLVAAGLFPPSDEHSWSDEVSWDPLPYKYLVDVMDKELRPYMCPHFMQQYNDVHRTPEIIALDAANQWIYEYLTNHTGQPMSSVLDIFSAYFGFVTQIEMGLPMEEWKTAIYPQPMKSIAVDYYYVATNTTGLKRLAGGSLLKKMLEDNMKKINGTLEPTERKLFLYSAHELNIAYFLITLGVFQPEIPPYGSHVLVELHLIDGEYGIKIFYQDYSTSELKLLVVPGCQEFCRFEEFVELLRYLIPEENECGI